MIDIVFDTACVNADSVQPCIQELASVSAQLWVQGDALLPEFKSLVSLELSGLKPANSLVVAVEKELVEQAKLLGFTVVSPAWLGEASADVTTCAEPELLFAAIKQQLQCGC